MQLIAKQGFKNTNTAKPLIEFAPEHDPIDKDGNTVPGRHAEAVHKGARFTIGGDKKLDEMKNLPAQRDLIRQLLSAGVIGDGNDVDLCKKVDAEVKLEKAQREENSRLLAAGSQGDAFRQAEAAGWTPPSKKPAPGPLKSAGAPGA
jgi:hypothetical protein